MDCECNQRLLLFLSPAAALSSARFLLAFRTTRTHRTLSAARAFSSLIPNKVARFATSIGALNSMACRDPLVKTIPELLTRFEGLLLKVLLLLPAAITGDTMSSESSSPSLSPLTPPPVFSPTARTILVPLAKKFRRDPTSNKLELYIISIAMPFVLVAFKLAARSLKALR